MKKIIVLLLICFAACFMSVCHAFSFWWNKTDKPAIIFNRHPITKENVMDMSSVFVPGSRIYYLILMPKTQNSRLLTLQIIKKGSKEYLGYSLFMTRTIRLKDEEERYFTDYIVINEKGAYIMKIYSYDNPTKVLTQAEFYVK